MAKRTVRRRACPQGRSSARQHGQASSPALSSASTTRGSSLTMSKAVPSRHPRGPLRSRPRDRRGGPSHFGPPHVAARTTGNATTPALSNVTVPVAAFRPPSRHLESRPTAVDTPVSGPVEIQVLSCATCWRAPVRAVVSAVVVAGPPPARITSPTTSASSPPTAAAARAFILTTE